MKDSLKETLQKALSEIKVTSFLDYKAYLEALYAFLKAREKRFSHKAFAELLGFGPSNITIDFIKGRRPVSLKNAQRIGQHLKFSSHDRKYFVTLVGYVNSSNDTARSNYLDDLLNLKRSVVAEPLSQAQIDFFSSWIHPVILEMTRLHDFCADPQWIAKKVLHKIRPKQAEASLQLLETLGLIAKEAGRVVPTGKDFSTPPSILDASLKKYHVEMMDRAKEALATLDGSERDISSFTFASTAATYELVKELVHEFQARLRALVGEDSQEEGIFQVNIQVFPFTKK